MASDLGFTPDEIAEHGSEIDDGMFMLSRSSGPVKAEETEQAEPVEKRRGKTRAQMEETVGKMAAQLMDHYIVNLNNPTLINPIRDGIPQCVSHPFVSGVKPGCAYGCTTGVLPRAMDHTLGDVFEWVKELLAFNYKRWIDKVRPDLKGYSGSI